MTDPKCNKDGAKKKSRKPVTYYPTSFKDPCTERSCYSVHYSRGLCRTHFLKVTDKEYEDAGLRVANRVE